MADDQDRNDGAELQRRRAAIDALDRELLHLISARARHAQAIGELKLRIVQNLLARDVVLDAVTRVYSHAQSLAQCVQWLARHLPSAARVAVASNAEAARLAAAEPAAAAIAGEAAAAIYGLDIIAAHIEDEPNNTTRFWVLGQHASAASGKDETSLVMSAQNQPGAMYALPD